MEFSITSSGEGHTHILVYELHSNIALDEFTITSIAKLDDRDWLSTDSSFGETFD
jgi:hypothetical protein